jgi:hypothetical protein
MDGPEEGRIK